VLGKLFEAIYLKVFVNIVVKRFTTVVYIETYSKKGVESSIEEEFETLELDEKMYDFITRYIKESPYYYISILDMSHTQGAVPTCSKHRMEYYVDVEEIEYKCNNNSWSYYTTQLALRDIKKRYAQIGVDYIFSPYSVLSYFFKDKIDAKLAMYILVQENFLSLAIFENSQLLYAHHLDMMTKDDFDGIDLEDDLDNSDLLMDDDAIELDDVSVADDAGGELEDFANIEDLDSIEEIDEFSDSKDIEEELLESTDVLEDADETKFNEDYQRFTLIQASVGQFYKDERYESRFIENVYVADSVGVTNDFKKYLEEEMFFNVYIRRTDVALEVCELTKRELGI
jgi:hypothetical protein